MTKTQIQTKLALLPLLVPVAVADGTNDDGDPVVEISYDSIPGPGQVFIQIAPSANESQMQDVVNNLPLLAANRLAALAIMLTPPLE